MVLAIINEIKIPITRFSLNLESFDARHTRLDMSLWSLRGCSSPWPFLSYHESLRKMYLSQTKWCFRKPVVRWAWWMSEVWQDWLCKESLDSDQNHSAKVRWMQLTRGLPVGDSNKWAEKSGDIVDRTSYSTTCAPVATRLTGFTSVGRSSLGQSAWFRGFGWWCVRC